MEYSKIQTLFKRDDAGIIIPTEFTYPEFEFMKDCKFRGELKVDGCLERNTRIIMADGTAKNITEVQVGDIILGYDTEGNEGVKEVQVQAVTQRPRAGVWVKIMSTRNNIGGGSNKGKTICTFDHKIWTPDRGYIEAHKLLPGDKILSVHRFSELSPIQKEILTGKMLGDGSLCVHPTALTASIEFGHNKAAMTIWTLQGLQELAGNTSTRISGYDSTITVGRTKNSSRIYQEFKHWITQNEGKQVPEDIFLTPIAIAFWYMDDGSLEHVDSQEDRVRLATNGFNVESCNRLLKELAKYGIFGKVKDYKGNTICLDTESSEKLFLLVYPYICKEYQYKLPERYRDCTPYLPKSKKNQYHTELVEQTIISVTEEKHSHVRWDLTTETHNFFTTSGLVHNTNTRVELYPNSDITKAFIEFKGRTDRAIIPEPLQIELNRLFNEEKVINYFDNSENDFNEPIIIYGEGYGKKIQSCGGKYCKDHAKFIVFDIKIGEWWLNRESIEQICKDLNLEVVPIMGYFTLQEAIDFVKTGFKDPIAEEDLDAEGLVLKTDLNIRRKNGERIITKIKTRDFRKYEAKYGKDYINHQLKNESKV